MTINTFFDAGDAIGLNDVRVWATRQAPSHIDARALGVATNEAHTIPTGANYVVFSANADFYARPDATAAVPGADVTDGSGSEMNPSSWALQGNTTINLIAPAACVVTMSFYF